MTEMPTEIRIKPVVSRKKTPVNEHCNESIELDSTINHSVNSK
jgi:hypothetical protein